MVFWIFWLSAITSLVIRSVGPVNWYFDMVWWLLWSINKQHSSVHSFLQFHTSFVKQVWISITTSVWCIWRADQPHWAHLSAPWLLLRRSGTLPSMTSRNVLQGVAAGFDFFFLAADCHTEKRSGKTSRNMARHRTHGCCRNQEGDSGVACSLELNLSCNELRWRISNCILIRGPTQSRCTGFY